MADILFDGLPVLDLLEINPSTSAVARLTQRDQSSISRIYRQVSRRLGLEFRKQTDGRYRASCNQVLLEGLRRSSQWIRLQANPAEPRWLACGQLQLSQASLIQPCDDPQRLLALIQERVVDLAVLSLAEPATITPDAALLMRPLLRHPDGVDQIVLRRDLEQQPAISVLIATIRQTYRQHLRQHPDLEWLG
jgi:hypothetical protein